MDKPPVNTLACFQDIVAATQKIRGFPASDALTGSLLRTLAASKPGGLFLEIGTGTGIATAWIVDGMDENAHLITVEKYETRAALAKYFLGYDLRITFQVMEAEVFLPAQRACSFDLIGEGLRFFEPEGNEQMRLERTRVLESPTRTDLWFRVVK